MNKILITSVLITFNSFVTIAQEIKVINEKKLNLGLDDKILVENQLVPNPNNPNHLLLSGMFVDTKDTDVFMGFAAVSFDKGKSWGNLKILDNHKEGADPWGIITKKGITISTILAGDNALAAHVYKSENNGKDWSKEPISVGKIKL